MDATRVWYACGWGLAYLWTLNWGWMALSPGGMLSRRRPLHEHQLSCYVWLSTFTCFLLKLNIPNYSLKFTLQPVIFSTQNSGDMGKRIDIKISNESTLAQNCLALLYMGLSNESTRFVRGIMGSGDMGKRIDIKISNESTLAQNCLALLYMGLSNESTRFVRGIMGSRNSLC